MSQTLTISLAAGAASTTVGGAFGTAYAVFPSAVSTGIPWLTDLAVTAVLPTQFTVAFSVPVPPGGAQLKVDLEGLPGAAQGAVTLADYLDDTRRLLRDEIGTGQGNLYSTTDLTAFINRAVQQRDMDLGMNRVRISFPLTASQYQYQISDILAGGVILSGPTFGVQVITVTPGIGDFIITATGLFATGYSVQVTTSWLTAKTVENQTSTSFQVEFNVPAPTATETVTLRITGAATTISPNVIDVLSIVITPLGTPPSGIKYPLARWPYSKIAYLLTSSYPTYPTIYAMYGVQTIMLAPPPANPYPAEFDFTAYASPLVNLLDADPLPYPWTDPIPFWAAAFAKFSVQRFDEAQQFEQQAITRTRRVMARGRPLSVANPWSDLPRSAR